MIDESDVFQKNFTGFMLYDPETNEEIHSQNSDKYFAPASNTKLFTFYAGLQELGDSIPAIRYTISGDSLIFTGTGDPSFLNPHLPDSKIYGFLKSSDKDLYYAKPPYELKPFGPGWTWDAYNYSYSAEKSAFPIYGNIARFYLSKEITDVAVQPRYFSGGILQKTSGELIERSIFENTFTYNPMVGKTVIEEEIPFKSSPELVVSLLSDTLQRPVTLLPAYTGSLSSTLYSIPSDSLYKRMLQVSDNFIAEQVLLMISSKLNDTLNSAAAIQYIEENYLAGLPDEPVWRDGSGLTRYNLFTPRSIVYLLNKIYQEVPQERLFSLMAAGGESGTLRNWYKAEEPYIYAKTGSLSNNHCLSGYIKTKSGKVLIFSFMLNNYVDTLNELKQEMEKVLWEVHLNY